MPKFFKKIILAGILILSTLIIICYYGLKTKSKEGLFSINDGDTPKTVFNNLARSGYINNHHFAYYYSRFFKPASFKKGKYKLNSIKNLNSLISYLSDSKNALTNEISITFIEGDWLKDFAYKIGEKTNIKAQELIDYWQDKAVLTALINKYSFLSDDILNPDIRYPLEGYLFPDTYNFFKETTCEQITTKILDNTQQVFDKLKNSFKQNKLSVHKIFTLASIVQYEAAKVEDMKLVASVFNNRLAIDMPLQSSVTICYALDVNRKDLNSWKACEYNPDYDSPYNTYRHYGLPPGPILSPSFQALEAVLKPANSNYYYFMANVCGDGKVYYSETLAQHQAYIKEYLTCY